ncbi:MAG: hypothetical protein IKG83_03900 [Prevotella sp.]|nr:hypothetical protein [Prevotella sp.]
MKKVWLGLCEQSNRELDATRRLMAQSIPAGDKLMFVVPPVGKAANIYCAMFREIAVSAVIVNNDKELVGSREEWNEFLKAAYYYGGLDIYTQVFVVEQHYDKKIYTEGEFAGFSVPDAWLRRRMSLSKEAQERQRTFGRARLKKLEELRKLGVDMRDFAAEVNSERKQWEEESGPDEDTE